MILIRAPRLLDPSLCMHTLHSVAQTQTLEGLLIVIHRVHTTVRYTGCSDMNNLFTDVRNIISTSAIKQQLFVYDLEMKRARNEAQSNK